MKQQASTKSWIGWRWWAQVLHGGRRFLNGTQQGDGMLQRCRPGWISQLGEGWEGEHPLPSTAQFGMKSMHGRIRKTKGGRARAAGKFRQHRLKILGKHYYKGEKTNPKKKPLVPANFCCFKHIENKALFKKKLFYASIQNSHSVTQVVLLQQLERQFVPLKYFITFYCRTWC